MPSHSYFGSGGKPPRSGVSRPGSLLLRGQLESTGKGKGLGKPATLMRGFSTPSDTSRELFPSQHPFPIQNCSLLHVRLPHLLSGCSPFPSISRFPSLYNTAPGVIPSLLGKAFRVPHARFVRWKKVRRISREGSHTRWQGKRHRHKQMLLGVHTVPHAACSQCSPEVWPGLSPSLPASPAQRPPGRAPQPPRR